MTSQVPKNLRATGFPSLGTIDIRGWIILCFWGHSCVLYGVHLRLWPPPPNSSGIHPHTTPDPLWTSGPWGGRACQTTHSWKPAKEASRVYSHCFLPILSLCNLKRVYYIKVASLTWCAKGRTISGVEGVLDQITGSALQEQGRKVRWLRVHMQNFSTKP